jgi:hypothetical protein
MKMRDEEGHRAMQAAGEAWKKIKTRSAKTWTEWTEVIGPGLVKAQAEAKSVSNKPSGKGYNIAMGALLEEYGFGDAVERFRSKVTRADLLHCMDYLTEIEAWRQQSDASVLEAVESKQKHHYPDHITLNHPTVVWRRFAASVEGKQALKDHGVEPKVRAPKATEDEVRRERDDLRERNKELQEELAARPAPVAAEPSTPVVTGDIDLARRAYITLLPTDPDARRQELAALAKALQGMITANPDVLQLELTADSAGSRASITTKPKRSRRKSLAKDHVEHIADAEVEVLTPSQAEAAAVLHRCFPEKYGPDGLRRVASEPEVDLGLPDSLRRIAKPPEVRVTVTKCEGEELKAAIEGGQRLAAAMSGETKRKRAKKKTEPETEPTDQEPHPTIQ